MVGIKDIAKELGLSSSVVSRSLNDNPDRNARVSAETKALVLETARKMGYRRNRGAEFLKRGKSAALGVFLPAYSNRLITDLVIGISEKANTKGFPINYYFGLTVENYLSFFEHSDHLSHPGIITYPSRLLEEELVLEKIAEYRKKHGAVVLLNGEMADSTIVNVNIDERHGATLAAERLLEIGCKTLFTVPYFANRTETFQEVAEKDGLPCLAVDWHVFKQCLDNAETMQKPIGVFATCDEDAMTAMAMLNNAGYTIAEDAFVIGYDDLSLTNCMSPPLTTIHQPMRQLGNIAVEKLISMIYGENVENTYVPTELIIRGSA